MSSPLFNKLVLITGLITAISLPGVASAGERDKFSQKYRAGDRLEHRSRVAHGDRDNHRKVTRDQRNNRHRHVNRRHRDDHAWNHRGHRHHRDGYWQHRRYGHHDHRHYQYYQRPGYYEGVRIDGLYLTPNLGLSINFGL